MSEPSPADRRIGVYVCSCGGNISDYVDVPQVIERVRDEPGVVVARRAMFTCSDATQQEIIADIRQQRLDGLVVASCSPKLHTETFRAVARRAGLNPYQYTQVNIREQCSWAHTDDHDGATGKAIGLVRAGIARTARTRPLEPITVETVPRALVIGGGITGLRAALALADLGLGVFLVEREATLGGWVGGFGAMFPHDRDGRTLIAGLVDRVRAREEITVFTGAEVVSRSGSFGNYRAGIRVSGTGTGIGANGGPDPKTAESITVEVGAVLVATGFDTYEPGEGELGYGQGGVLTLPQFKTLVDATDGPLTHQGRPVRTIAYIYCVGSRQPHGTPGANEHCSRFCCTATVHTALRVSARDASVRQYHLYRDMRSYGKYELLFDASRRAGSRYLKVVDDQPPEVAAQDGPAGGLTVTAHDALAGGEELALPVDLVVLVTGAVPRANEELTGVLKIPVGTDRFYNEIHPKLRPVETVVDGVTIAGACQGPKTSIEAVTSGLAAVAQSAAILKRGHAELDPLVAVVDPLACGWCDRCQDSCPYGAIGRAKRGESEVAVIDETVCKGCGGCVPVCPRDAIDLHGYTDTQITSMIDGLAEAVA
ncbi:MAG: CoB--CoM heterodisulfide reductase iron-sulfur subunit A family protein [Dactylosporangium sp.]|nr:4Fe-4S binding protein [Dactylosporangium sp.]NNJ62061.1 CoB--CoM heterodisulfide reductase iron-sulfur subunit A family protein [Dactylosporangium sp.]